MKKHLLASAVVLALTACSEPSSQKNNPPQSEIAPAVQNDNQASAVDSAQINQQFSQFASDLIDQLWQRNPGYAVYVGYYKYDDQLSVPSADKLNRDVAIAKQQLAKLNEFDVNALNTNNASDYYILKNHLESQVFSVEELKSHQWDPSSYNVAGVFGVILNTEYKPMEERLRTIYRRMQSIKDYYQAAQQNITTPTIPHTELAISQNQGTINLFDGALKQAVEQSNLSEQEKADFAVAIDQSVTAINDYISFLQNTLSDIKQDGTAKDFRIGESLYEKKFKLDIYSGLTAKQLYQKAVAEKARVHTEMIKLTEQLWPKYFAEQAMPEDKLIAVKQLIDHLSVKHVERDNFVAAIKAQIPELEKFVMEKNLIEMDPDKPLVVRETPEYMRGFAGASISAPGPYDSGANTYYNVTPLDDFNDEQAESYLREYNHWILQILNIHEAVPGHYTQLVHSNKSKSLVKSIFGNGAMVEGWAVYTERMMLEQGYGDYESELWLMYYKWNLRVIMNSIIDYAIQVKGIGEQEALDMMINEAFQQQAEAQGKWRRATLSQVQLTSYFTGYSEIYDLREELKQKMGNDFDLADFHNTFLSYGSAPVPIIRQMMLADQP
ncbi:DUF885 domain-containing protein [Thalassotalea ponticola]|uniref:DUF885 domain-containing protein n=1 Tax=Thalassotalea ponticola TaxID=1523392 RepID=UPI0025B3EFA5|nr:DUF885 domain-containing protein [Thalassotalea ponticola]MDN3652018.1 DUF885 domain-containing protein [Thalassotalea ponticola]